MEQLHNQEVIKPSKITLHFFRHSIKGEGAGVNDYELPLSEKGRDLATEQSSTDTNLDQAIAFGSPRVRTQETALRKMAGSSLNANSNDDLDSLLNTIGDNFEFGSKLGVDTRLDMADDSSTDFGKELNNAYKRGEYLKYVVEQSDNRKDELGTPDAEGYSKKASNIAKIVLKYIKVSQRWNELVNSSEKDYKEELERFLSSHQGVMESFLAKVIDKLKGREQRDLFVASLKNAGFDFVEGFDVTITQSMNSDEPVVHIEYKNGEFVFSEDVSLEIIEEIVNEGDR